MEYLQYFLHLDRYLLEFINAYGVLVYLVVFITILCETGLVITPFLPGDSLIFSLGSIAAHNQSSLRMLILLPLLIIASILGNHLNYRLGRAFRSHKFTTNKHWLFNMEYLEQAHQFYAAQGSKTIILARFIPIVRTFVPFVAGMSCMNINLFNFYNIISAILWITSLLFAGYFLGSIPIVQNNFSIIIYGIISCSILPPCIIFIYKKVFKRIYLHKHKYKL